MLERVNQLRALLEADQGVWITSYPNIFYYSGFTSEDGSLIITKDKAWLVTDSRYTIQAAEQAEGFEIKSSRDGIDRLLSETGAREFGFEEEHLSWAVHEKTLKSVKGIDFTPFGGVISSLRQKKDREEICRIREVERLGDAAFAHVLPMIREGKTELELAIELEFYMRRNGAARLSFETIAASGFRSAMPHGTASTKVLKKGELVTLDFGCVLDGYCSDMTRTVALGELGTKEKEIYETVLSAQETALKAIRPGMKCREIDKIARDVIAENGYGEQFGHSLGHSVGIEIHESPNFAPRCETVLEPGHVITVEPGVYLEGLGGVRIEDLIVVTENGMENLTHAPKELMIL